MKQIPKKFRAPRASTSAGVGFAVLQINNPFSEGKV